HEDLRVDGVAVDWWVEGRGPEAVVHAVHVAGLARGLAQAADRWHLRSDVEVALLDPERAAELTAEAAWSPGAERGPGTGRGPGTERGPGVETAQGADPGAPG